MRGWDTQSMEPATQVVLPPARHARPPRGPFWPRTWRDAMYAAAAALLAALAVAFAGLDILMILYAARGHR